MTGLTVSAAWRRGQAQARAAMAAQQPDGPTVVLSIDGYPERRHVTFHRACMWAVGCCRCDVPAVLRFAVDTPAELAVAVAGGRL